MIKLLRTLLLAGASLLALASSASAEPISLAVSFLTSSFLGGSLTIAGISASQLALTAIGIGASLATSLLGGKQKAADPGQYRSTFEASESSEVNAIGRCRIGGLKAFGNTAALNRYRMVLHSAQPFVAIEEFFLGSRPVTVEVNGDVSSPPYAKPGGSWVNWQTKSGEGVVTAWADLITAFPALWTSAHKAQGIAQSLIKYVSPGRGVAPEKFGKLYDSGEPAGEIVARFGRVYDPRDPVCSPTDPATWIWSDNGVLCAARIMLSYPNLTVASFDWDFIAAEATKADAPVATLTGTEPRSRCSGVWLSEDKRVDTMVQVLRSIGAEIVMSDSGLIRIRLIDDAPTAEIAYTARNIINWDWKSGPDAAERPNVCRVKYYSPERNYEMAEIDMSGIAWARIDSEVAAYGEKYLDIDLPFCRSASQAQRIARREFELARADRGQAITNMAGMAAWGLTYASIELDDLDESPLVKIEPPRCDEASGEVEIPFAIWPPALIDNPWNPATMEAPAPDAIPSLEYQAELDTPAAPVAAAIVQYADLSYEIRLKFDGVAGATQAEAVYRGYTGGLPNAFAGMDEYLAPSNYWYGLIGASLAGQRVDFKTRFFNADDEGSHFSPLLTVNPITINNTTPAAPVIDVDVTTGSAGVSPYEFDIAVTTTDLHVALLEIHVDALSDGEHDLESDGRPEVAVTGHYEVTIQSTPQTFEVTAIAYTSNGTPSATATYTYTVPGTG